MAGPLDLRGRVTMIDAGASRVLRRIGTAMAMVGKNSGIRAIGTAFMGATSAAANFAGQLTSIIGPLAAIVGLGGGLGVMAAVQNYASRTDSLAKFGRTVSLTTQQMREMDFIADRQGASFATVQSAMFSLRKRIGELKDGTGGLYSYLKKGHPEWIAQYEAAKTTEEQLALTARAYEHFEKTGKGEAMLSSAMSRGGAKEMAKFLQGGVENLRALSVEARYFRGELGEGASAAAENFMDKVANLGQSIMG